jgi:hypothetical protein
LVTRLRAVIDAPSVEPIAMSALGGGFGGDRGSFSSEGTATRL